VPGLDRSIGSVEPVADAVAEEVTAADARATILREIEQIVAEVSPIWSRGRVELIPVMPAEPLDMSVGDFDGERSQRLIEMGRSDMCAVLEGLHGAD